MKLLSPSAVLVLSAAGSFGLVSLISPMPMPRGGGLEDLRISRDIVSLTDQEEPGNAALNSARPLVSRFRTVLELLGIPGSWAEELAAADTGGFPALLERMKDLPARQRECLRELLFGRWAELDAAGGAALLAGYPLKNDLTDFLRIWSRLDFEAAAVKAEEHGPDQLRRTARDHALLDPQGLLRWLENRPDLNPITLFDSDSRENPEALKRLSAQDPARMLAWSREVPEDKLKPGFVQDLAAGLAKADPEKALEWAKSLKDTARSHAALAGAAGVLAARDPLRALRIAAGMQASGSYDPLNSQYEIARKLDLSNVDQIQGWLAQLPPSVFRSALTRKMVRDQLDRDPGRAFALAALLGSEAGMLNRAEIPMAMANSPEEARKLLDAAAGAAGSSLRDTLSREALLRWMEVSPSSLADYLKGRMDTPLMQSMRESLQAGLGVQKMLTGAADPALSEVIGYSRAAYVKELAVVNPDQAAAELGQVADPVARHQLAAEIADRWAKYNRTGVMDWAAGLQDPVDQAAAWRAVSEAWTREDSWQASNWISSLPAGPGRDAAVQAMTSEISAADPDLAWSWARSMTDPALRAEALASAAESWRRKDPAALEAALNDPALTAAERGRVVEKLQAHGPK
ncbi:MAG: hypothetical protein V4726_22810 [Verrucomicrobiota bacterium]